MRANLLFNKKSRHIFIVCGGILPFIFFSVWVSLPRDIGAVGFEIGRGMGLTEISRTLTEKGVIASPAAFKLHAILSGGANRLKPGSYKLEGRMSVNGILKILVRGPREEIAVFVPEGSSVFEIDRLLAEKRIIAPGALLDFDLTSLKGDYGFLTEGNLPVDALGKESEGFFFPDTYKFHTESSGEEVARKFLDRFGEEVWPMLKNTKNWYSTLIMASLLEKEVPFRRDRELVAGILGKRLQIGMPLQVDAAICYIKRKTLGTKFEKCYPFAKSDWSAASPYNTYLNQGLPPAPIANPGKEAVKAAINPRSSAYLYYLSDPETSRTIFSKTLEEHNANRSRYLNIP